MPIVISPNKFFAKDQNGGGYLPANAVSQQTTEEQIATLEAKGTEERSAIEAKGVETRASIPDNYTELSDNVVNLKSNLTNFNCYDIFKDFCNYNNKTTGGVTYTWDAEKRVCTVNGGPAGSTNYDVMYSNTQNIPSQIIPGETYFLNVSTTFTSLALRIYIYHSNGTSESTNYTKNSLLTIPTDIVGMIVRIQLANGKTANNDKISVSLTKAKSNKQLTDEEAFTGVITTSDGYNSIDNIDKFGVYFISTESNITDFPFSSGWLIVNPTTIGAVTNTMQIAIRWNNAASGNNAVYRTKNNATWRDWATLQDEEPVRRALDEIHRFNCFDLANYSNGTSGTQYGITYTKNADNSWTINGSTTSENYSFRNILGYDTGLPEFIVPGRKYHITISPDSIAYIQLYTYFDDGTHTSENLPRDYEFTIPENTTGIILRFRVDKNKTVDNQRVDVKILAVPVLGGEGGGDTYIINQEVHNDTFENQYNISVEPQITTDTNGWLQPVDIESEDETGKTDMTSAIMAMLTQTGYCHLAPGVFYVSGNIDMPEGSMLEGCGKETVIRLLQSVTECYAVKMEKYNSVSNLRISGSYTNIPYSSFTADRGTRHGIIFNSRYVEGTRQTEHCTVQNIYLDNFTGCGIKCYNASINTARGMYASQIKIARCQTGVFVDEYSEFNKFELVNIRHCYIACENDGGNNMFIGCTFGATNTGFLIDNSLDDKANNAHGGVVGCTFCHIGDNQGVAIAVKNIVNGFTFSDCQVWYCSLLIEDSYGVAFTGMEFGRGTTGGGATIRINRGGAVIFTGCMFMNDVRYAPDIVVTDNDKVHFTGCYGSHSGEEITAVES